MNTLALDRSVSIPGWRHGMHCREPRRHQFRSDPIYVSFYINSTNWVGSGRTHHPHKPLLTTENNASSGPLYVSDRLHRGKSASQMGIQDGQNIDETRVGQDPRTLLSNAQLRGATATAMDIRATVTRWVRSLERKVVFPNTHVWQRTRTAL